eukprot:TRINITY_DN55480_c0_g1_i1.p1 TRINITY_DN55480_c0_g1~~TRINITY_DN55480_c0_g1_i1.p1  ORF type:complete len:163 (-),score=32.42 TRINITY_DN55480_c0_g1_i1:475-963(-)
MSGAQMLGVNSALLTEVPDYKDAIDSEPDRIDRAIRHVIGKTLGKQAFHRSSLSAWCQEIIQGSQEELESMELASSKNFHFVVTTVINRRTSAVHGRFSLRLGKKEHSFAHLAAVTPATGVSVQWDGETDGIICVRDGNASMECTTTVHAVRTYQKVDVPDT